MCIQTGRLFLNAKQHVAYEDDMKGDCFTPVTCMQSAAMHEEKFKVLFLVDNQKA